jgi:hypothetical protein
MPGEGANSRRQNRRWFLRGLLEIYTPEAETIIRSYLSKFSQVAGAALRKSGEFFPAMHLPPGFGAVNFPLPRATKEAFSCLHSIFSQLPSRQGRENFFFACGR